MNSASVKAMTMKMAAEEISFPVERGSSDGKNEISNATAKAVICTTRDSDLSRMGD